VSTSIRRMKICDPCVARDADGTQVDPAYR
jgi:hypothetical protein